MIPYWLSVVLLVAIWMTAGVMLFLRILRETRAREAQRFIAACRRFEKSEEGGQ